MAVRRTLGIPLADLVNNRLRVTPIHVIRTLDEMETMRVGSAPLVGVECGEIAVCVLLKDGAICGAMQDETEAKQKGSE